MILYLLLIFPLLVYGLERPEHCRVIPVIFILPQILVGMNAYSVS